MIIEIKNTNKIVKLFFVSIFLTLALVVSVLIAHASTVPDPPTNLQATPQSGGASMSWTAPANDGGSPLTGYELSYRAGATGAFTDYNLSNGDATATTAVVTGLTNNTAYEFRVSAINAVGTSSPSSSKYFTPGTIGLFESFSTTTINTSRWTERDTAGAGGSIGNVQQNGSALTIVGNGNAGTNGLTSINTFDRTQGDLYIDADITDSNCGLSGTTMALGYGDPVYTSSTSTSYVVAITNGVVKMQYYINGTKNKDNTTSFTCTTNTPFHISLRVLQTSGAQVFINGSSTILAQANAGTMSNKSVFLDSFSASATTTLDNLSVIAPSTAPGAPTNLSATAGDGQVSLSWSAPGSIGGSAITSYEVKYKSQTDFGYNTTINTMSTNTSTTVTGLTNGARYYFVVLADNNSGAGATSTSVGSFPVATSSQSPTIATTTIEGTARVGEKLMGAYTFLDPNRDLEATSTYQWFTSTTLNGTYTPISSATSQTYQATSTDLNNYLKFQVTPVSMNSPAIGTTATSGAVQVLGSQSYINDILTTGQSLGAGLGGSPALTTSQPYSNKRLDPSDTNFIALVEANQETIDSAEGNFLTATSSGQTFQDVVTNASVSGADYAQIKKGTATYTRTITQATSAYNDAPALGKVSRVIGMNVLHGGTDDSEGFTPVYDSYLDEWQRNFNTDLQAVTGQRANIPFFLEQNSSFTVYNGGAAEATSSMPKVQLDIALYNPTRYVMVAPDYMLVRNTNIPIHFTNVGYRKMGEYYGKVLNQVLVNRKPWIPLVPVSIKRNANIIYAKFHVPVAPLVLDTSLITAQTNYGFEYSDDSSSASISSVSLLNADTVKITLSTTPSGTNQRLRYAYTGTVGATPGPDNPSGSSPGSVRGNLRDSDTSTSTATFSSGEPLYDWAMSFDEPIFSATTAPIFSNISATGSTTATTTVATTTVSWNTDLGASTQIQFGPTSIYLASSTVTDTTAVGQLNHSVNINNLISCSVYHYQVLSTDILAQNSATSSDNTLATSGCPGQAAILASSTAYIDSTSGGSLALVTATSSASTTAPASFGTSAYFQIKQIPESIAVATTSLPAGLVAVGTNFYDIKALTNSTTTENSFAQPISVTLSYNDSDLTNANVSTSTLTLKRWDGITWNDLSSCSTNTVTKNVTCSTSNFSTFGMFGESTTPDVTPPVISNVASSTSDTSATITWDTNEAATSTVNYGLNTSYGTASSSSALVTSHSISLSSLSPGTLYHFQVSSADASGNLATSSDYTFLTSTTPDVTPPVISNVASSTSDTSATITWDTNEAATSTVNYGLNTSYGTASSSSALVTSHSISLSSLSPGTLYHFQVSSADASGNLATSSDYTFLTSTTPDVTPPVISNVASSTSDTSATITWDTNEAATSTVNYGLNTSYGTASSSSALVTSHSISLSSLSPGTLYHFQVSSADASGNLATSSDYTFLTSTTPDVTPPVISNVASSTSDTSATITWDTNEAATSTVNYGLNTSYGTASSSSALVTSHSISLSSLSPGTLYHFQVSSADASGNLATSSDYTFLTSTTPDVTPPVISNVASSTSDTSATITWDTNEAATSTVNYGLNTSYGTASSSSALVTSHSISLSSLSPGTLYHFQVSSADASGNLATSSDYTFLTSTTPDVTPPVISNVASSTSDTSATITWDTNEAATSTVNYGLNTSYGTASSSSALVTSHSISLSSLSPGTLYHFQVSSADASGNLATSSDYTFLTSTTPDVTPPVISNVASSTSDTSATITWDTNEAATSTVNYGLNTSYGTASSSSALVTSHSISLSSLSPGTLYHFQVSSADASGNLATSSDYTFLTSTTGGGGGGGGGGSHGGGGGGSSGGETPPPIVPPFIPPSDCGPGDNFSASTGLPCGGSTTLPPPPVQTGIFTRDLTLGSTGADVISLQTILVAQGYLVIPPGVSMGYFGNLTQTALAEYQSAHNISPAIGYFGPITRGYLSSLQGGVSPTARYIFTISTNPGESNTDTLPLQKFLVSNGFLTGYFMPGVYDEATLRAVGSFQIFTGILNSPQDSGYGFIGPLTKSKLNSY